MSVSQVIAASGRPLNRGSHLSGDTCHMMPRSLARRAGGEGPHRDGVDPVRPAGHPWGSTRPCSGPGSPGRGPGSPHPNGGRPAHPRGCGLGPPMAFGRPGVTPREALGAGGVPRGTPGGAGRGGCPSLGAESDGETSTAVSVLAGKERDVPVTAPGTGPGGAGPDPGHGRERRPGAQGDGVGVAVTRGAGVGHGPVAEHAVGTAAWRVARRGGSGERGGPGVTPVAGVAQAAGTAGVVSVAQAVGGSDVVGVDAGAPRACVGGMRLAAGGRRARLPGLPRGAGLVRGRRRRRRCPARLGIGRDGSGKGGRSRWSGCLRELYDDVAGWCGRDRQIRQVRQVRQRG